MKRVLITGVTGQDGSYLAELLLSKGYEVYGLVNQDENRELPYVKDLLPKITVLFGDLTDHNSLKEACDKARADEVYNLAAVSDLKTAIEHPKKTMDVNYVGVRILLDEARRVNPKVRFFQALSSRLLDNSSNPQSELSPLAEPANAYDEAKRKVYEELILPSRDDKGQYICGGFLFNHESPRRDERFVTRKITRSLVKIKLGVEEVLELGNLDLERDWGFSGDFVEAMWLMLQQEKPQDYVIATGKVHSVRDFVNAAAEALDMNIAWEGKGVATVGKDDSENIIVRINKEWFTEESGISVGDISKIKKELGWKPKTNFKDLVRLMVEQDLRELKS